MLTKFTLTLRQIEILRAIMITGSITGAARFLGVAQPGVSRMLKHMEAGLGINLFVRQAGRLVPAPEAKDIFAQVQEVYRGLENLNHTVEQFRRGQDVELSLGSVPSIAQAMVPRAITRLKARFPDIRVNIELLKVEEAVDFLMLRKGELVCMSYRFDHPSIAFLPLARGELVCLAHKDHPIAAQAAVSAADIARYPLIGIDPKDPYGGILAGLLDSRGLAYDIVIRARFGVTVIGLVRQNLGIAVLDSFTTQDLQDDSDGLVVLPIDEPTPFQTYVAIRNDIEPSGFSSAFIDCLRREMMQTEAGK
ncbi:LysR family transcriptional regulator [Polymorphum gilvum]|uniref:Putative transcriptional regulator, LysR family protein n=1 Tax=Polymorphum gilvum (strain LMG 25793 / CGMCC 1.9160 / SL003B-26A1) TaxID=991905 RepID=F2J2L5_POLGS|nr:LysR family transcriptional regulator [Polymorphum gilvum]ADZ70928.1 Putative transcriptional regulator, LysR family protein [Polymorphum gilvum SL003B-26A1]